MVCVPVHFMLMLLNILSALLQKTHEPVMCCYKLVRVLFKWWGVQSRIEKFAMKVCRK